MSWEEFTNIATKVAQEEGYPVSVLLGQAALETGRNLGSAMGNNFFGIKGGGTAGTQKLRTQEATPTGTFYDTVSNFAAYHSPEDSIRAYINLIKNRYPDAWSQRHDPYKMVEAIKRGGYATDPQYVAKVTNTPEFRTNANREVLGAQRTADYVAESGDYGDYEDYSPTPTPAKKKSFMDNLWGYIFPQADASYDPTNPGGIRNYTYQGAQPTQQGYMNYTVKPGDTMWGIANQYLGGGDNWNQLKGYTGSPNQLPVGQNLQIPQARSYTRPVPQGNSTPANANYSSASSGASYAPPPAQQPKPTQQVSQPSASLNFSPSKPSGQAAQNKAIVDKATTTNRGLQLTI